MKLSFKTAVKKAKKLYKSGKYNKFSDAVKAAYKKRPSKCRPAKKTRRRVAKVSRVSSVKRNSVGSVKKQTEVKLGRAMVEHYKTQSIKRTRQLGAQISSLKKKLRSL